MSSVLVPSPKSPLEFSLREEVRRLRDRLAAASDSLHRFEFEIKCEGRLDGEIKITFELGLNYDVAVKGNSIAAIEAEALRRQDWKAANAPLLLTADDTTTLSDPSQE